MKPVLNCGLPGGRAKDQANTADSQGDYVDIVLTQNAKKRQGQTEAKKADRTRNEVQKWFDSPQTKFSLSRTIGCAVSAHGDKY
jgi:hypothetical protein